MRESRNSTAVQIVSQRFVVSAVRFLVCLAAFPSSGFAVDLTFNISYIAEAKNPSLSGMVYGDIWQEGGYAYVGSDVNGGGMNIFSISNSGVPTFLAKYTGDQFEDVEVWDGIGYFGSDVTTNSTGTGVDIVDLSIPFDPLAFDVDPTVNIDTHFNGNNCTAAGCGHNKVHTLSVAKSSDGNSYLYTADNATDIIKISRVFDPSDLSTVKPQIVKSLDLGLGPIGGTDIAAHEVQVRNNRMYVASKDNAQTSCCGWVSIYDVANPSNPVLLKKWEAGVRVHTATPSADGRTLVVAEEHPDNQFGYGLTNVKIYDISMINSANDPDNPLLLSTLNSSNVCHNGPCISAYSAHHPHVHGNLVFIPWYEAGLLVFNIIDPVHPAFVGAYDTYPGTSINYNGDWGVDLSMGLNRVLISDRTRGLISVNASAVLVPGDYNQDMVVNTADYDAWRNAYGTSSSGLHTGAFADGNNNGVVDAADYVIWRNHNGQTGPSGAGADAIAGEATVPEPSTILLFAIFVVPMVSRRRPRT